MNQQVMQGSLGALLVLGLCHSVALGLDVGDKAPPLTVQEWVKGQSFDLQSVKGKKVVVVEFWATWCGPCRASIPHLTDLQKKYKNDVIVVGMTSEDPGNKLPGVKSFVERQGEAMGYTVAFDKDGQTSDDYMRAAEMNGIPTAFVVDKTGTLIWIGSPFANLDQVVEQAVLGTFDPVLLKNISYAKREIDISMKLEAWGDAIKAIEEYRSLVQVSPEEGESLDWQVFECLAKNRRTRSEARQFGDELVGRTKEGGTLNQYAWAMLVDDTYKGKYNELALVAAQKANKLTKNADPLIMDTLARALYMTGSVEEAVALQTKAIELADAEQKPGLQQSLVEYQGK
jgi:thiol-disulfide isomerase/thioredoxin